MINLEIEAAKLAHAIDKPFDFALKRRLISTFIDGRAMLLRRSITSNRHIPATCIQSFAIPISKLNAFDINYVDNYKVSVGTVETVPSPIRLNTDIPFISVTSLDGSINLAHSDIATVRFNSSAGQFVSGTGRYVYHGEYVSAYHNEGALLSMGMLMFRGVMENPLDVKDYSGKFIYSETRFPMPMDMLMEVRNMILQGELNIVPETQEITINDDK